MKKISILEKLEKTGVVAVVRGESQEECYRTAVSCIRGGILAIEVTFTAPKADKVIEQLISEYSEYDVIIGAGTVLDSTTARLAIMSGAQFVVSPSFDKEVALLCNSYQVPYMPGCMTVTECQEALKYGSDIIKIFPGNILGKEFISSLKGPLPYINVMPTGGVNLSNMHEWFELGVIAVGVGSNLTKSAKVGDYQSVEENCKKYHQEFLKISKQYNK